MTTKEDRRRSREESGAAAGGGGGGSSSKKKREGTADGGTGTDPACANAHALRMLDARFSLHLHPSRAGDALAGAREALAAQLLRHSADLGGVLLAVARERLVPPPDDDDGSDGGGTAAASPSAHHAPLHPYHPYLRVTAAARALVFRLPPKGHPLVGHVTKVGRDYVAVLVLGCLGAAIGARHIRGDFKFRAASAAVEGAGGEEAEGGKEGEQQQQQEGQQQEEQTDAAATPAATVVPAAWVSRMDPSHVLTVGTEVRFEVAGSVSAAGLYSVLGALRQPWTGATSHVASVPVSVSAPRGGGGGGDCSSDKDEGGGSDEERQRRRRGGGDKEEEKKRSKDKKEGDKTNKEKKDKDKERREKKDKKDEKKKKEK